MRTQLDGDSVDDLLQAVRFAKYILVSYLSQKDARLFS